VPLRSLPEHDSFHCQRGQWPFLVGVSYIRIPKDLVRSIKESAKEYVTSKAPVHFAGPRNAGDSFVALFHGHRIGH